LININLPPSVAEVLSQAQKDLRDANQPEPSRSRPQPMERPDSHPKVLPGPVLDSQIYTARMGPVAFDAKFSQFGYYLSRLFDTIQMQWYSLLADVTLGQENRPSSVLVTIHP
jgi:hypothetical protein